MTKEEAIEFGNIWLQINEDCKDSSTYAFFNMAIEALAQEPNAWSLDDAREDFMYDVYNTLDFLQTNDEANRIIDSFDRVTAGIKQEPILDKIRAEIEQEYKDECEHFYGQGLRRAIGIIDKYKSEKYIANKSTLNAIPKKATNGDMVIEGEMTEEEHDDMDK